MDIMRDNPNPVYHTFSKRGYNFTMVCPPVRDDIPQTIVLTLHTTGYFVVRVVLFRNIVIVLKNIVLCCQSI